MRTAGSRSWPLWLALALLASCVVVALQALLGRTEGRLVYALDDAYIHMALARNVATHGVWGCTPFQFSAASSSPLWTALLAVAYLVTGAHEITPLILNLLLLALTLAVADSFVSRHGGGALIRAATLLGLVVTFPMPAMALFGMEHVLHLLLTIAFAEAALGGLLTPPSSASAGRRLDRVVGVFAALLAASRYEGLFLVGVAVLAYAVDRQWRRAVVIATSGALAPLVVGAIAIAHGSFGLPNSLMLKAGGESASTWYAVLRPIGAADLWFLEQHPALLILAGGGLLIGALAWWHTRRLRRASVLLPWTLAAIVVLHAHFELSSAFWVYRYDAYLLGFGVVTAGVVAGAVSSAAITASWPRVLAPALGVLGVVALIGDPRGGLSPATEIESASLTLREHITAAAFVHDWHGGDIVLVNDLGAMAFFGHARVVDIFGLCDIEPVRLRRAGAYTRDAVETWTRPLTPTLAIVQQSWGWAADHVPSTWTRVAEVDVLPEHRLLGFYATSPDATTARRLRAEVAYFYGTTAGAAGYRVHLF